MPYFIRDAKIKDVLRKTRKCNSADVRRVFDRAKQKKGLELEEVGTLLSIQDKGLENELFETAKQIKNEIYGNRLVLFAPLYASNHCINNCMYCGFRSENKTARMKLSIEQIKSEIKKIIEMGHKRVLLEFGEHPSINTISYVVNAIRAIYDTKTSYGEIRRVNVNIAATDRHDYRLLKQAGIGTYQLFQETYHKPTYEKLHRGPKSNYRRQLYAHHEAFSAGIDDVGLGVLYGLYYYKYEVLALMMHAKQLEKEFNVGPHTISVPRWKPAEGVEWKRPPNSVSENELLKIIAIIRLALPYTGIIISTRERPETRLKAFSIGVSQTSAASRTSPGGYTSGHALEQFDISDHRSLDETIKYMILAGLLPSFCTACYRVGRTGERFMSLAKPGDIHKFCFPNALLTFREYLIDYASEEVRAIGEKYIHEMINTIDAKTREIICKRLERINNGERDVFI